MLVISHGLWRSAFGGDPRVLGKTIRVRGVGYEIVGVLPQGFEYPARADFWTTLALMAPEWERNPTQEALDLVGRLKPGAAPAEALAEVNSALQPLVPDGSNWRAVQHSLSDVIVGDVNVRLNAPDRMPPQTHVVR